jgi:uncharacterized membrane protein
MKIPVPAVVLAFTGLFAAALLGAAHLLDLPVPCGRSTGCVTVALHPSSKLLGVPVAFFGVAAYLTILFLLARPSLTRFVRLALSGVTGSGAAISVGLLIYAHQVIGATCAWCVVSGTAMVLLFIASLYLLKIREVIPGVNHVWIWTLGIITALALGMQVGLMRKKALTPPISASRLADLNETDLVDPAKSLGPADASVTIIEFGDLSCWACQTSFESLVKYQASHPKSVRLAFRHVPLWQLRGHEFSRVSAGVSEMMAEEGKFWQFLARVYPYSSHLNRDVIIDAVKRLGTDPVKIEQRLNDPADPAIARVLHDEELADRLGINQTPTFIVLVSGKPPISANQRTLGRILNSPEVQSRLAGVPAPIPQ